MHTSETPRPSHTWRAAAAVLCAATLAVGCGTEPSSEAPETPAASVPTEEHGAEHSDTPSTMSAPAGARVFFVEPKEGAALTSPVHFVFGSENVQIAAVPEKVEKPREGVAHYHLGVEVDCMPSGEVIPKGTPSWVHFGKGDNTFDLQLTPGQHKVALQLADDEHRTIRGLCQSMTLNVK
jgi:hypothetical protein